LFLGMELLILAILYFVCWVCYCWF
jgi:hypothetical protein